jgi:hypothetical protein
MLVAFKGYGVDFIIEGRVELTASRLTDLVNGSDTLLIRDAILEGLHDLARVAVPDHTIRRDDLLAVKVAGPRGGRLRRLPTTAHRVQAQLGPYNVLGRLHTTPGDSVSHRLASPGPMLPLTDATIAYVIGGILEVRDAATILINRDLATWVRDEESDVIVLPTAPPTRAPSIAPPAILSTIARPR